MKVFGLLTVAEQNVGVCNCELEEENVHTSPDLPTIDSLFPTSE